MENVAFVFPGQGSQAVGMLAELAQSNDIIGKTFAEASEVLGYDLWDLVANGPAETLNETQRRRPMQNKSSIQRAQATLTWLFL